VARDDLLVAEVGLRQVGDRACQVCAERVLFSQRVELGGDTNERFLHEVLGELSLPRQHEREAQRYRCVYAIEPVEQELVAHLQRRDRLHDDQTPWFARQLHALIVRDAASVRQPRRPEAVARVV
jgi:hypothetical protein